jgi:hypothetical protein
MAGLDGVKIEDLTMAEIRGRKHIHALVDYVRQHHPGFEQCFIVDVAPQTVCARPGCWRASTS